MSTIELINSISEFADMHEFMEDEELDEVMAAIVKIIASPDIPPQKGIPLIAKLQAISAKFALLAAWYTTAEKGSPGSVNHTKKSVYYSAAKAVSELVESLKYSVRYQL